MSRDQFSFLWRNFHIYSVDLSYVEKEQDDCYVGGNEESEENGLTGDPIDRHQHQSQNVEQNDTDTSTNQQHNIVEIEASSANDSEGSSIGEAAIEGTADTDDEVDPTLWFSKIILLLFQKVSILFISVFGTYLSMDEMMICMCDV